MGGHVRFKDDDTNEDGEDEMMDVEKNKEEEKEEAGEQRVVSHDFGPDPEFTIRKPVANLKTMMMMMMAAEEEVKDKEDKRRRSAVKLRDKWTEEKGASSDACYITQIESNFDFSKVCYRTSANEAKVFDTTTTTTTNNNNNNNNNNVMILKHERAMTDAHFPVPNELTTILSCSHDNTVREWDARTNNNNCAVAQARVPNHILGKNGSLETCSIGGANETILAVSCGEKILFYDRRMIRQGGGRGGKETMMIKQFEDAHSETVTKLRFHPEKRHILQTSSVDGLTCTFNLLNEIDDENSLVSIGTANAAINEFGFLSSTTSSGSTSKNILWALTGIEEIHLFDCDAGVATCGVEIGHVKNAREKAREAAKQAKAKMSVKKASFSSSISKKGLKDLIENGVDYIINVIDGGEANNHKYYACCGTINGTVGLFPMAYDEIAMRSETSTQPLTLLAPEYVLPNDSSSEQGGRGGDREDLMMKGHGDIVRCLLASSSSTAMTTDSQNVLHLYTGGEDSSVCSWTTTKDEGHNNNNNNNNDNNNNNNNNNNNVGFGGGAMRNSPSSSIRSGRESPY